LSIRRAKPIDFLVSVNRERGRIKGMKSKRFRINLEISKNLWEDLPSVAEQRRGFKPDLISYRSHRVTCCTLEGEWFDQAMETAALMLGTDKSRGYCLEMICADFLAGANLDTRTQQCSCNPCHDSSNSCLANNGRPFCTKWPGRFREPDSTKHPPRRRLDPKLYERLRQHVLQRDGWSSGIA
jgi:hypothetical protein